MLTHRRPAKNITQPSHNAAGPVFSGLARGIFIIIVIVIVIVIIIIIIIIIIISSSSSSSIVLL